MTVHDDLDRLLTRWLDETAGAGAPDYLDETITGIASLRQRPAWLSPGRWLPMRLTMPRVALPRVVPIVILLALLIAALLIAVIFAGNQQRLLAQRLPAPFGLARTGLLVFDSNDDIYVASTDGSRGPRHRSPARASRPGRPWSRDGTHVAYLVDDHSGTAELRVSAADGSGAITVASSARRGPMRHLAHGRDSCPTPAAPRALRGGHRHRGPLPAADGLEDVLWLLDGV